MFRTTVTPKFGDLDGLRHINNNTLGDWFETCLLYTSPSPRDYAASRMPSSA